MYTTAKARHSPTPMILSGSGCRRRDDVDDDEHQEDLADQRAQHPPAAAVVPLDLGEPTVGLRLAGIRCGGIDRAHRVILPHRGRHPR